MTPGKRKEGIIIALIKGVEGRNGLRENVGVLLPISFSTVLYRRCGVADGHLSLKIPTELRRYR